MSVASHPRRPSRPHPSFLCGDRSCHNLTVIRTIVIITVAVIVTIVVVILVIVVSSVFFFVVFIASVAIAAIVTAMIAVAITDALMDEWLTSSQLDTEVPRWTSPPPRGVEPDGQHHDAGGASGTSREDIS
jgi:hypothetical protein